MEHRIIEVNLIVEGYSPRRDFSRKEELKKSIEKEGLLEPLLVRKDRDVYPIIDGNMRFRAVKEVGWKTVECLIENADEEKSCRLSYIKNTHRWNLNPIEEALHLQTVKDKFGYNNEDLVRLGFRSHRSSLDNKLSLLSLPEDIQQKIADGTIKPTAAYHIAQRLDDEKDQRKIAQDIINNGGMSPEKVMNKIKSLIDSRKNQGEKVQIKIPRGNIPGVFFKDSRNMSELADESVGLVVTSPPYWVEMDYEKGVSFQDHLTILDKVFKECVRVLIPGGKFCVNVGDILTYGSRVNGKPEIELIGDHIMEIMQKHGMRLRDRVIWNKGYNWVNNPQVSYHWGIQHTSYRVLNNFEYIYIFQKEGKREVPFDLEHDSRISKDEWKTLVNGVWEIPPVRSQEDHPAQFPEELPRRLIKMFSFKGDIVLDPFGGTMTTVKIAKELDRIGIGYEKDETYKPTIMKKLGVKEEDLKKHEPVQKPTRNKDRNLKTKFSQVIDEILSTSGRSASEIKFLQVPFPLKGEITKEDMTIEWRNEGRHPDPSGNSPRLICKTDDYDEENQESHSDRVKNAVMKIAA